MSLSITITITITITSTSTMAEPPVPLLHRRGKPAFAHGGRRPAFGHLGAFAEEELFHLALQERARLGVGHAQAVVVDDQRALRPPELPCLLGDAVVDPLAEFPLDRRFFQAGEFLVELRAVDRSCHFLVLLYPDAARVAFRPAWKAVIASLAATTRGSSRASRSAWARGRATRSASRATSVYTRIPAQPSERVARSSCRAVGRAAQPGRPRLLIPVSLFQRLVPTASASSIACAGSTQQSTRSGDMGSSA